MITFFLCTFILCISISDINNDNNYNSDIDNYKSNNNDNNVYEYKNKLITELDNMFRRKQTYEGINGTLIEDIILYDYNIINKTSISIEEKYDIIYDSLDTKWNNTFYYFDEILNDVNPIKGWIGRKMFGSNCVVIERATVTRYYKCEGCIIERALGCLSDFRQNVSGNVPRGCNITYIGPLTQPKCCPVIAKDAAGKMNLIAKTAGYPDTLRCIQSVGCGDTDVYTSLLEECQYTCPLELNSEDPSVGKIAFSDSGGNDICLATYSASNRYTVSYILTIIIFIMSLIIL